MFFFNYNVKCDPSAVFHDISLLSYIPLPLLLMHMKPSEALFSMKTLCFLEQEAVHDDVQCV